MRPKGLSQRRLAMGPDRTEQLDYGAVPHLHGWLKKIFTRGNSSVMRSISF
jgi:hypothetical protein